MQGAIYYVFYGSHCRHMSFSFTIELTATNDPKINIVKIMFDIVGHFYEISSLKCRRYLDIKRKDAHLSHPDVMVIMMNPGSSYPLDRIDNNQMASAAHPDPTQDQIMEVMDNTGLNYARVLNLSDTRQSSSSEFYKFLKSEDSRTIPHSIFHDSRVAELSSLFQSNVPVIYGCGVNVNLEKLARIAINRLSVSSPFGIKKNETDWAYYHPLPRIYSKKIEWVSVVSTQFTST